MPRTISRHKYNKHGRIKTTVTVEESEWDDQQRGWILALESWRLSHCSGCGQPLEQCTDADNDGRYSVDPIRCYGCAAIAHASVKYREDQAASALRYRVSLRRRG